PQDGVVVTVTPATVDVPAGGTADVSVSIEADNARLQPLTTAGGNIDITGLPNAAHFSWGFTKASRLYTTYDRGTAWSFLFSNRAESSLIPVGDRESEALLSPGAYKLLLFSVDVSDDGEFASDARLISRDNVNVDGDVAIAISGAEATHTISFAGRDARGALLRDAKDDYISFTRVYPPAEWGASGLLMPWGPGPDSLRVSQLNGFKLSTGEVLVSFDDHRIAAVLHDPLPMPLDHDVEIGGGGAGMLATYVRLAIPEAKANVLAVVGQPSVGTNALNAIVFTHRITEPTWFARLEVTPNMTGDSTSPVTFEVDDVNAIPQYTTPSIVVMNGRIVAKDARSGDDGGGVLQFGFGPLLPSLRLILAPLPAGGGSWSSGQLDLRFLRGLGDVSYAARRHASTTVTDASGNILLGPGLASQSEIGLGKKLVRHAETVVNDTLYPDIARKTTMTLTFDNQHADFVPPTFTSVMLLDDYGRMANELTPHAGGSLLFSVADYIDGNFNGDLWQPTPSDAMHVAYRYRGAQTWTPLPSGQAQTDANGLIYRIDLKSVANVDDALVDMKLDIADSSGNTATLVMEPAFAVKAVGAIRHRAGGK
ncbi:MAG TPA: hypothetical protein VIW45_17040, partial [Vicinamibacterales bacterium]